MRLLRGALAGNQARGLGLGSSGGGNCRCSEQGVWPLHPRQRAAPHGVQAAGPATVGAEDPPRAPAWRCQPGEAQAGAGPSAHAHRAPASSRLCCSGSCFVWVAQLLGNEIFTGQ